MCMASYLPPEIEPDIEGLTNGGISNPDGHGWAIADEDMIVMGRALKLEKALDEFCVARKKHMYGPALFHSRIGTHGPVNLSNVHPFFVGGSHKTVVAHNGILPPSAHPALGDDRSDTRKFADEILPVRFKHLDRITVQSALTQWIGSWNKLVILTVDPRYQSSAYIFNQDAGEWDIGTGLWHSNRDYREPFGRWVPQSTTKSDPFKSVVVKSAKDSADVFAGSTNEDLVWNCQYCGMGDVDKWGFCDVCETCEDCGMTWGECQCYDFDAHRVVHDMATNG